MEMMLIALGGWNRSYLPLGDHRGLSLQKWKIPLWNLSRQYDRLFHHGNLFRVAP